MAIASEWIGMKASAPLRALDFGGWTDAAFSPEGAVLNFAIRERAEVVARFDEPGLPDLSPVAERWLSGWRALHPEDRIRADLRCDAPPGMGLGGSGAASVSLVAAIRALKGQPLDREEIVREAHRLEVEGLGAMAGVQDHRAAAYGGILFHRGAYPSFRTEPLSIPPSTIGEIERRGLLLSTGIAHASGDLHASVERRIREGRPEAVAALRALREIAVESREALLSEDWRELSRLMARSHVAHRELSPEIVPDEIEAIRRLALSVGVDGFKLNGAGGGGTATLLIEPERRREIAERLTDRGRSVRPFRLSETGLRVEPMRGTDFARPFRPREAIRA